MQVTTGDNLVFFKKVVMQVESGSIELNLYFIQAKDDMGIQEWTK